MARRRRSLHRRGNHTVEQVSLPWIAQQTSRYVRFEREGDLPRETQKACLILACLKAFSSTWIDKLSRFDHRLCIAGFPKSLCRLDFLPLH
jgi:hypothetical protein